MDAARSQPRSRQRGPEYPFVQIARVQIPSSLVREYQFVGDIILTLLEGFQQPLLAESVEHPSQNARHIDATALIALGCRHFPSRIVPANPDKAIGVRLVLAELHVAPLQCESFA